MNRNRYIEKAFLLLMGSALFIAVFSFGGAAAYEAVWSKGETLPAEAEIGGVDVGGMTESAASKTVNEAWNTWQNRAGFMLRLFDEEKVIAADNMEAEVEQSINQALENSGTVPLQTVWKSEEHSLSSVLDDFSYTGLTERVNMPQLRHKLTSINDITRDSLVTVDVGESFHEELPLDSGVVQEAAVTPGSGSSNLQEWAEALDGYEIAAASSFSLQDALEESGVTLYDGPAMDALASVLFQVLAETNFELRERHINDDLPDYADVGEDAHIDVSAEDLVFYNPNIYAYQWSINWNSNQLTASLHGPSFLHSYTMEKRAQEKIEPRTIVRFDETRSAGDRQTITDGRPGHYAEVFRVIRNADGDVLTEKKLAQDYYPPVHRREEWSLQERSQMEDEIPENEWQEENPADSEDTDEDETGELEEGKEEDGPDNNEEQSENTDNDSSNGGSEITGSDEEEPIKGYD